MQVNRYIAVPKNRLLTQRIFFVVRILLFFAIIYYLWLGLIANQQIILDLGKFSFPRQQVPYIYLLSTLLLLPVNWLLEARKWQIIAAGSGLNLKESLRGVVLGLTLDNILPFGTGSISGRLVTIDKDQRYMIIPGILAGQVAQSLVTFLFGFIGFAMVWQRASDRFTLDSSTTLIILAIGVLAVFTAVLFRTSLLNFLKPLKTYPIRSWFSIGGLSLLRYLVFLMQFLLLATFFESGTEIILLFGAATWVFAARSFMPKVTNLERLGIRALAIVFFCELFLIPPSGLLLTVISLWFINLVIPSLIGLALLSRVERKDVL